MEDLPYSVAKEVLPIMGVELVVHVLSDGQRIIEADSMAAFLAAMEGGESITREDAERLARALRGETPPNRPHSWVRSTLGHGETMCSRCFMTNREAAALRVLHGPCEPSQPGEETP